MGPTYHRRRFGYCKCWELGCSTMQNSCCEKYPRDALRDIHPSVVTTNLDRSRTIDCFFGTLVSAIPLPWSRIGIVLYVSTMSKAISISLNLMPHVPGGTILVWVVEEFPDAVLDHNVVVVVVVTGAAA